MYVPQVSVEFYGDRYLFCMLSSGHGIYSMSILTCPSGLRSQQQSGCGVLLGIMDDPDEVSGVDVVVGRASVSVLVEVVEVLVIGEVVLVVELVVELVVLVVELVVVELVVLVVELVVLVVELVVELVVLVVELVVLVVELVVLVVELVVLVDELVLVDVVEDTRSNTQSP